MRDSDSDPSSQMASPSDTPLASRGTAPRPAIAVVAVHGVADQPPNASARAIAALLLQRCDTATYTASHEIILQIPTRPALVVPRVEPVLAPGSGVSRLSGRLDDLFDDRSIYVRKVAELGGDPSLGSNPGRLPDPSRAPDHQFMRDQLVDYPPGSREPYETIRLETQRLGPASQPELDVHVYEMYWADLSRLGKGVPRFFGELYQLLFHAANLGRQTLDYAAIEHDYQRRWRHLSNVHKWAVRLLTTVIPTLALVILAIGLVPLALTLPQSLQLPLAIGILGLVIALALGARRYRRGPPSSLGLWTLRAAVVLAVVAVLARLLLKRDITYASYLMVAESLLVSGAVLLLILRAFDRYHPGALAVGKMLFVLGALTLVVTSFFPLHGAAEVSAAAGLSIAGLRLTRSTLWAVEVLWTVGIVGWVALFLLGVIAWILGWLAVKVPSEAGDLAELDAVTSRAVRAVRTSRLTLVLPAAAFLLVTTTLWYVIVDATEALVKRSPVPGLLEVQHCAISRWIAECGSLTEFLHSLLWQTSTLGFPVAVLFLAAGLGLLAWWLLPIVITELRVPVEQGPPFHLSRRMGGWLSTGVSYTLNGIGRVVMIAVLAFAIAYGLSRYEAEVVARAGSVGNLLFVAGSIARRGLELLGSFLAAGAVGLLALRRGRFEVLSRSLRPILDVALDVDGYLREQPRACTPRARIAERYVSLLRYLCAWRNPTDARAPYAGIILLAHSQGTIVSADLLGFLRREPDPDLASILDGAGRGDATVTIPTYLFTMGSPLRQLYEQFFPHLYSWVTRRPSKWEHVDLVAPASVHAAPPAGGKDEVLSGNPDPAGLRLTRWVNAYRSGDYIGRFFWRDESAKALYDPSATASDASNTRRELCVGAGAHTHYWDSEVIARELDLLIAEAGRSAGSGRSP